MPPRVISDENAHHRIIGTQRTDQIESRAGQPILPVYRQPADQPISAENGGDEQDLADFHAQVEQQQRPYFLTFGQADSGQRASKA